MSSRASDRQLLFGILALQNDFIDRDQLLAALRVWVDDKSRPLEDVLREQGALAEDVGDLLGALVAKHIERHGGDAEHSLAALSTVLPLREEIGNLGDADIQATLTVVPATGPSATAPVTVRPAGDRFRIVRPHAEGGLGRVSVAIDRELEREVAFKEIKESYADDQLSRERFTFEAEVTGSLEHPGIVPVYGLGHHDDGRPFYAMRFVRGHSLQDAIRDFHAQDEKGTWTADERAGEFRKLLGRYCDVCDAIEYAHSRGVLHRDLKPGNVMLGKYGETLVVDWGLAKIIGRDQPTDAVDADATLQPRSGSSMAPTLAGTTIGSPAYMSPEQAEGRLDELGPASDVYSLGATLYALLTNTAPHLPTKGDSDLPTILAVAREGRIDRPRDRKPDVPLPLEAVCLKAMSLKPSARYASPAVLAEDVQAWLADRCPKAYPEPLPTKLARVARRHRGLVAAGLVATILLAVSIVSLAYQSRLNRANERLTDVNETLDERNVELADANGALDTTNQRLLSANDELAKARETLERISYDDAVFLAQRLSGEGAVDRARERLATCEPARRGWEWGHVHLALDGPVIGTLEGLKERIEVVAFSPDGSRIAAAGWDREVQLFDGNTGEAVTTIDDVPVVFALQFSPDGRRIAVAGAAGSIQLLDPVEGRKVGTLVGHEDRVNALSFDPTGNRLASASDDGTVRIWDVAESRAILVIEGHAGNVRDVSFSPDGTKLVSGGDAARVWDATTGEPAGTFDNRFVTMAVTFSPDGRRIAAVGAGGTVVVCDVAEARVLETLYGGESAVEAAVAFSPDGRRLATHCAGGEESTVQLWDATTFQWIDEFDVQPWHALLAFSPCGTRLFSASKDNAILGWNAHDGSPVAPFHGHRANVAALAISPDGARVVSASADGTLRLWNAVEGQAIAKLVGHEQHVSRVLFTPDGRHLASTSSDGTVQFWNVEDGLPDFEIESHTRDVDHITYSPDGSLFATSGGYTEDKDDKVRLWDARDGSLRGVCEGHTKQIRRIVFSPDGKLLASAASDWTVRLWDVEKAVETAVLRADHETVRHVAFSPDGDRVAAVCEREPIRIWNVDGRELDPVEPTDGIAIVSEHSGRERIAVVERGDELRLRDVLTGQVVTSLEKGTLDPITDPLQFVHRFELSPDGKRIATPNGTAIRLWDTTDGRVVATLLGHEWDGIQLAFDPTGRRLASSSFSGPVRLWDAVVGRPLARFEALNWTGDVAFSPDGSRIAVAGGDGSVWLLFSEPETPTRRHARHVRWREERAFAAMNDWNWFGAAFHIRQLVRVVGEEEVRPETLGLAELMSGDEAEYRRICARLIEEYEPNDDHRAVELAATAWLCTLRKGSTDDPAKVVEIARAAVAKAPEEVLTHCELVAALYRAGRHAEAVTEFNGIEAAVPLRIRCFYALAHFRLGHTDAARGYLTDASEQIDRDRFSGTFDPFAQARAELVRDEAREVIGEEDVP